MEQQGRHTLSSVGLQRFEQRLERIVEGGFGKAFRSGLQPVEIGRKVTRELDAQRQMGVHGVPVAPNNIGVYLSHPDFDRFESFADALARELAELAREHAREEGYHFVGSVTVHLVPDDELRVGECDVVAEIAAGVRVGSLLLPDGRRVPLGETTMTIGRLPECDIVVSDPKASRRHTEIRPAGNGFLLVDLQSTNGTRVNGAPVGEHILVDGDRIGVGATEFRFEAS
jgi:nucleotide-binding universal stress UspA family protein